MALIVFLDSGPLGLISKPTGKPDADRCRAWLRRLIASRARVVIPEIIDYELRRELIRVGARAGIARLSRLEAALEYRPITTEAMRLAAELWSIARRAGLPTAHPEALDVDCILAAQALSVRKPSSRVIVATTNVGHLAQFVDAQPWESLA